MRVRLLRKRERERQESNHDQQILIERLQSGNNWDNCSTLEEGRTNRTRDGLKDTVLGKFQTQSEMQNKSEDSNRRSKCTGRNGVARLFQEILALNDCLQLVRCDIISIPFLRFSRSICISDKNNKATAVVAISSARLEYRIGYAMIPANRNQSNSPAQITSVLSKMRSIITPRSPRPHERVQRRLALHPNR